MTQHTPEPWGLSTHPHHAPGMRPDIEERYALRETDYRRAMACVNACRGLSNGILGKIAKSGGQLWTKEEELLHIWQCVQACKGIDPEAVGELVKAAKALSYDLIEASRGADRQIDPDFAEELQPLLDALQVVLTKAKGVTP